MTRRRRLTRTGIEGASKSFWLSLGGWVGRVGCHVKNDEVNHPMDLDLDTRLIAELEE